MDLCELIAEGRGISGPLNYGGRWKNVQGVEALMSEERVGVVGRGVGIRICMGMDVYILYE